MADAQNPFEIPDYERPNMTWKCGHADQDNPCPLGPSRLGICQDPNDCRPVNREGTFYCNRSIKQGGPCSTGPLPDGACGHHREKCAPQKSLRKRRAVFVFSTVAMMIGIIAFVLPQQWKIELLAPGGLTRNHAQILTKSENRCVACHEAGDMTLVGWIKNGLLPQDSNHNSNETQSARCLECHRDSFDATLALNPHGTDLASLTKKKAATEKAEDFPENLVAVSHQLSAGNIACSTCHREHHGTHHNLSAMTNQQCATCHQNQFHDFENHPEFKNWPTPNDQHIAFDHKTHGIKYFPESKTEFSCPPLPRDIGH